MIVVTGATGQLGRAIVEHLRTRVPAAEIGVSVRDPGKAEDLRRCACAAATSTTRPAWTHAFEGASRS